MRLYTKRIKLYTVTAAVSITACTCALGLSSVAFADNQSATIPSTNSVNSPVYDTAANYTKVSEDDNSIEYTYENNPKKNHESISRYNFR